VTLESTRDVGIQPLDTAGSAALAKRVLLHNRALYLLNKPPGLNVHDEDGEPGVLQTLALSGNDEALWPVHRLDKITSGLLLVARQQEAARQLSMAFEARHIDKYYLAIGCGKPQKKQGWIIGDMQRARGGSWKLSRSKNNPAITYFISQSIGNGRRLFLLKPFTGKTHQLRVAMKALGSPILGDARYKGEAADRGYLHAYGLCLPSEPALECWGEAPLRWTAPMADGEAFQQPEVAALLAQWAEPWALSWPEKS